MMALREDINIDKVSMRHFREALKRVKPSITEDMIRYYKLWSERTRSIRERKVTKTSYFI